MLPKIQVIVAVGIEQSVEQQLQQILPKCSSNYEKNEEGGGKRLARVPRGWAEISGGSSQTWGG